MLLRPVLPFFLLPLLLLAAVPVPAADAVASDMLPEEDALNLRCLREAYPALHGLEADSRGSLWLVFAGGRRVLYREAPHMEMTAGVDVATSMAAPILLSLTGRRRRRASLRAGSVPTTFSGRSMARAARA